MGSALLPLELFNDAARLAGGMAASHLIPRLTEEANECMDGLIRQLATKVRAQFFYVPATRIWKQVNQRSGITQACRSCLVCMHQLKPCQKILHADTIDFAKFRQ